MNYNVIHDYLSQVGAAYASRSQDPFTLASLLVIDAQKHALLSHALRAVSTSLLADTRCPPILAYHPRLQCSPVSASKFGSAQEAAHSFARTKDGQIGAFHRLALQLLGYSTSHCAIGSSRSCSTAHPGLQTRL